jgi:hypothetical protein
VCRHGPRKPERTFFAVPQFTFATIWRIDLRCESDPLSITRCSDLLRLIFDVAGIRAVRFSWWLLN